MTVYAFLLAESYLLLVALMRRPRYRHQVERVAIVLALVVCVLYLVQVTQAWILWWNTVGRLTVPPVRPGYLGLNIGPNPLATLVMLLGAFGLASGQLQGRRGRVVAVVLVALIGITVLITGSRGAWLGAVVGLAASAVAGLLFVPPLRARAGTLTRSQTGRAAVGLMVGGIAIAVVYAGNQRSAELG